MITDRSNPRFDVGMELLCSLPKETNPVHVSDLAKEFGYPTQLGIKTIVDKLNKQGFGIKMWPFKGRGMLAGISSATWAKCQDIGRAYWEAAYEQRASRAA